MKSLNAWEVKTIKYGEALETHTLLPSLTKNEIAAIRISDFFSQDELRNVVQNIRQHTISWYRNADHKQGRIGISATEYHSKANGKNLYFELEPECSKQRETLFSGAPDPIQRISELFTKSYPVSIAREPSLNNTQYFSGLIRAMGAKSTLHFDYAPHQLPGWWVSNTEEQFALVLYLQMPSTGGELLIYNHPWEQKDDIFNEDKIEKGPYGFNPVFLEQERPTVVTPVAGDLIIFRSRNFHQVKEISPSQYRLTFNSFLNLKEGTLFLWS